MVVYVVVSMRVYVSLNAALMIRLVQQTDPPSIPVAKLFPSGVFPVSCLCITDVMLCVCAFWCMLIAHGRCSWVRSTTMSTAICSAPHQLNVASAIACRAISTT